VRIVKQVLKVMGVLLVIAALAAGIFVYTQTSKFDASMETVYDVPIRAVVRSSRSLPPATSARKSVPRFASRRVTLVANVYALTRGRSLSVVAQRSHCCGSGSLFVVSHTNPFAALSANTVTGRT
jgi:hypothetical protein